MPEILVKQTSIADNNVQAEDDLGLFSSTLWSAITTDRPFEATLPYTFTAAQRRVTTEILSDLALNKPMSRLLQGDVGAGKTAVAAAALFVAALNGYQGAIMAPNRTTRGTARTQYRRHAGAFRYSHCPADR